MFNKKSIAVAILSLISVDVLAFQSDLDLEYSSLDDLSIVELGYRYHFTDVSLDSTAWSEAAFMNRSSYLNVGAIRLDSDFSDDTANGFNLGTRVNFAEDWYLEGEYIDIEDFNALTAGVGYYYAKNHTVFVQYLTSENASDEEATAFTLGMKNVYSLSGGQFFNVEASITQAETEFDSDDLITLALAGDYYFTAQTSVGFDLAFYDDSDVDEDKGINVKHYFNENIGLSLAYSDDGDDDAITVGLNARF